jgi:hypothetical protein
MGTAVAHGSDGSDYIVVATEWADFGASSGKVFAFKNMGPRPRMLIPETLVQLPSTNVAEAGGPANPITRTDNDAVMKWAAIT